jgi:urease accessory protein
MHLPCKLRHVRLMSLLIAILVAPCAAFAHPEGHEALGTWAGFLHPLSGIDHALAMIAVGLWAVQSGRAATWLLPITFPLAMIVGALLARANFPLPSLETMIAVSVMLMGAAVAAGLRLPLLASSALVAFFAIFHGYAHFIEGPAGDSSPAYGAGFVSATVLLHACGIAGGTLLRQLHRSSFVRVGGAVIAVSGTALLVF